MSSTVPERRGRGTQTVIVFTGPTLPPSDARRILDAEYRSPAKAGDVLAAAHSQPAAIVLIDGLFETVPAVWHKEILYALSDGIHVYGSSSMGALRAAELYTFGMIGIGKIFEQYCNGDLEDDDEVAVVHSPESEGWIVQSEAMVNIREALNLAAAESVVTAVTRDRLTAVGKAVHYSDRSWPALFQLATNEGIPAHELERLKHFLRIRDTNLKRQDAVELLNRVANDMARGLEPFRPNFKLERTSFFEALRKSVL